MRHLPASTLAVPLTLMVLAPVPVEPGAWTLAEGDGQLILTTGRNTAPAMLNHQSTPLEHL